MVINSQAGDFTYRPNPAEPEDARRLSATVQVPSMDIADRAWVENIREYISKTMPPIARVCNTAIALADKLIPGHKRQAAQGYLVPNVDGSKNLDAVFGHNADLDFFIMLSSSATVLGNIGQANYHIAILYMGSLAAKSAIIQPATYFTNVGCVVESTDRTDALEGQFRTIRLMPLSETFC